MNRAIRPVFSNEGGLFPVTFPSETTSRRIAVIGGVNMDITGTPDTAMIDGDSNPGTVVLSPGGVGRNLAENLRRLGNQVYMVTVFGEDANAEILKKHCLDLGFDLSMSVTVPGGRTSVYLCLNGSDGNVLGAVSDMAIVDRITPELLEPLLPELNRMDGVFMDANLPEEVLTFLGRNLTVPLIADPVSVKKSVRLKDALPYLLTMKPNVPEAEQLTGIRIGTDAGLEKAAEALYTCGVKNVFISLGARGVHVYDGICHRNLPCCPGPVVNTTGCGDAFLASAGDALLAGLGAVEAASAGLTASALCARTTLAVSPDLTRNRLYTVPAGPSV